MGLNLPVLGQHLDVMHFAIALHPGFSAQNAASGLAAYLLNSLGERLAIIVLRNPENNALGVICYGARRSERHSGANNKNGQKSHQSHIVSVSPGGPDVDSHFNALAWIVRHTGRILLAFVAIHDVVAINALFLTAAVASLATFDGA